MRATPQPLKQAALASAKVLLAAARGLRAWSERHRLPLLGLALAAFCGGLAFSIAALDLSLSDISPIPLLTLALVLGPITIAYSAVNMQLMARAIGLRTDFWHGIRVSAYAQVAELLPLPGGAIVRTAALMERGGTTRGSASIVAAFALLWIACAAVGGGIALLSLDYVGMFLLVGGLAAVGAILSWLASLAGWRIAAFALTLRVAGLVLVAVRIAVAFLVIGMVIESLDAFAFAFAIVLGSAASIVPAGLGIGEGLSALMAQPSGVAPAAAFTAAAINRLAGFAVNMLVAGLATIFRPARLMPSGQHDG